MASCHLCQQPTARYTRRLTAIGLVTTCHVCANPQHSLAAVATPFADLTLDHQFGDDGKPLHVTSLRQLRAAEARLHFKSLVANEDSANFDRPPQSQHGDLFRSMSEEGKWMYPEVAKPMLREMQENGELGSEIL